MSQLVLEDVAATALALGVAALLALGGRRVLTAAAIAGCVALLPLARFVIAPVPPLVGTAALAGVLLPLQAWGLARLPPGQWATARRLGAAPGVILRRLVLPALLPFVVAGLLGGGLLVACRPPPPPGPVMLPYPATEAG